MPDSGRPLCAMVSALYRDFEGGQRVIGPLTLRYEDRDDSWVGQARPGPAGQILAGSAVRGRARQ